MKNKRIFRSVTALLAALVIMGGFSVTAYAGGGEEWEDYEPIPEETETEPQPLTPEGNMTLVDDIEGEAAEDKQFITVVSKSGNYFYIIIDRAEDGENTVHFLNQVDEADLMAIIGEEETEEAPAVCECEDKCFAGSVNTACPVCAVNMSECAGEEAEPEPEETEPPAEEEESGGMGGVLLIVLLLAAGGGGAFYYFKILKPKQDAAKGNSDLDNYDFDEDEEEAEDEEMYLEDEQEDEEE